MLIKAAGRFLTAFFISIVLGLSLYLAMHFVVQPIANKIRPETPHRNEGSQSIQPGENVSSQPERETESFNISNFIRGLLSLGKNGVVFVVMTAMVVWFRSILKKNKPKTAQR